MQQKLSGETTICKWKSGKKAAFSIGADDSMHSQLDFMIPEMLKRGFAGTFWINPGRGTVGERGFCWESRCDEWLAAARRGCDFGNHTVYHVGARYFEEAEYEIGESARTIWQANPGQRLQLFMGGGGTAWNVPREEIDALLQKYFCVRGRGGGVDGPCWHEEANTSATAAELKSYVDAAISEGSWHLIACHGVGPKAEWLGTDAGPFIALLDYLVEKKDEIWVGTNTQVHKYDRERSAATVTVTDAGDSHIGIELACGLDIWLYDQPLTLRTVVPDNWLRCSVMQGKKTIVCAQQSHLLQYEALPGLGEINIMPCE